MAGSQEPGACVSNLYSQANPGGCVCVFVYVWSVFARVGRKALPYLRRVITS